MWGTSLLYTYGLWKIAKSADELTLYRCLAVGIDIAILTLGSASLQSLLQAYKDGREV